MKIEAYYDEKNIKTETIDVYYFKKTNELNI